MFWAVYVSTLSIRRVPRDASRFLSMSVFQKISMKLSLAMFRFQPPQYNQIIAENQLGVMGANTRKVVVGQKAFRQLPQCVAPPASMAEAGTSSTNSSSHLTSPSTVGQDPLFLSYILTPHTPIYSASNPTSYQRSSHKPPILSVPCVPSRTAHNMTSAPPARDPSRPADAANHGSLTAHTHTSTTSPTSRTRRAAHSCCGASHCEHACLKSSIRRQLPNIRIDMVGLPCVHM